MREPLPFDRGVRYGVAVASVFFASYLLIATDFSAIVQQADYSGSIGTDVPQVDVLEFFVILGLYLLSFVMLPTNGYRRIAAVAITCVAMFLWTAGGIYQGLGELDDSAVLGVLLHQGTVVLVAGLGGWLVARGYHPLSWIVVPVLLVVPPLVSRQLADADVTTGAVTLASEGSIAATWAVGYLVARGIDRLVDRRRARSEDRSGTAPHDFGRGDAHRGPLS